MSVTSSEIFTFPGSFCSSVSVYSNGTVATDSTALSLIFNTALAIVPSSSLPVPFTTMASVGSNEAPSAGSSIEQTGAAFLSTSVTVTISLATRPRLFSTSSIIT